MFSFQSHRTEAIKTSMTIYSYSVLTCKANSGMQYCHIHFNVELLYKAYTPETVDRLDIRKQCFSIGNHK